jgi:tRNA(Ile)-lysidine synthase
MNSFSQKIHHAIIKNQLIHSGDRVLVGVSSGADSMALLHILNQLRSSLGFQIHVAHINHHLRRGAQTDQRFVEKFCAAINVSCTTQDLDLQHKIRQGGSVEEIAREERFKALTALAKKTRSNLIALAHHRDDLAETVLLRLLRGTGLQGLQAILAKRTINGHTVIRPLLDVSRNDIETYLMKNKITFRTDPTNRQTHFFRNKIRLELLPYLQKNYQNNIAEVLCNLAATAGEDYDYLRNETLKIFPKLIMNHPTPGSIALHQEKLQQLPNALKRMALRFAIETVKGNTLALTLTHLKEIEDLLTNRPAGSVVDLPHQTHVLKTKTALIIT